MRIPPKSTLTYTLLHYTTIFRSRHRNEANCRNETSHDHRTHLLGHALANRLDERHAILEPLAYRGHDNEPVEDCHTCKADEADRRGHREVDPGEREGEYPASKIGRAHV